MKIFSRNRDSIDVRAKDSVMRLLYAYEKFKNEEGKKNALSFKKNAEFDNRDKDIENAIKLINNNADFAYMRSVVDYLHDHDYIQKLCEIQNQDVDYFMLTKSGVLFHENNGFEKELKEQRQISNENFFKALTIILAIAAIATPLVYDSLRDTTDEKFEKVNTKLDSIGEELNRIQIKNLETNKPVNDTLPNNRYNALPGVQ